MAGLKAAYDKAVAFVVALGLLASAAYLAVSVGNINRDLKREDERLTRLVPKYKLAPALKTGPMEEALDRLDDPLQIEPGDARLVVAERRVHCVNHECLKPVFFYAATCPFCNAAQPKAPPQDDEDGDGMPDAWERQHGLNPTMREDGEMDADADGYSNRDEFDGDSDPNNPDSKPEAWSKLRVRRIVPKAFPLVWMGSIGEQFQLNNWQTGQSHAAKVGETIDGWKIVRVETRFEEQKLPGIDTPIKVDVSVLILKKGDQTAELVKEKRLEAFSYSAVIVFLLDRSTRDVQPGTRFEVEGAAYKVVDIRDDLVKIEDIKRGKTKALEKETAAEQKGLEEKRPGEDQADPEVLELIRLLQGVDEEPLKEE
ncbi:MAG: hypothetical protein JXR37_33390 [Kiritimatiellae bacterium]|nr:hypothetical protein [Kiritimatiellia bacterium]